MTAPDPLAPYKAALRAHYPEPEVIYRAARRRRAARRTFAVAVIAIGAAFLGWRDPAYRTQSFQTAIGEHRDWTLADGSRLSLNTGSALRAEWHLRSRRLTLLRGEAAFDVAASKLRRFSVAVDDVRITDIGTVFAVRQADARIRVQVFAGEVEVRSPDGIQRLGAGSGIELDHGKLRSAATVRMQDLAWREGRIVFDGTPLAEAVAEIARYRRAPARIADAGAAQLRISGQFDTARPDAMLDALPRILPVDLRRTADGGVEIGLRKS
ncbi:FecR family protein [Solimonas soli]|uniref:FecR family protein n=1 Tax=Solimonas soli TaxID=413479 RepID=UPI0004872EF6|nr:FecR domain-containing protein [Solimonas soli]